MNFSLESVLQTPAKISQPDRQKMFTIMYKENFSKEILKKIFLNEVHFLNKFYKTKFSKMNAMFKNINI